MNLSTRVITELSKSGNQVDAIPTEGGEIKIAHIKHVKPVLPVDRVVDAVPDYTTFGRMTKLSFNPDKVDDLGWKLTTRISSLPVPGTTLNSTVIRNSVPTTDCVVTSAMSPVVTAVTSTVI